MASIPSSRRRLTSDPIDEGMWQSFDQSINPCCGKVISVVSWFDGEKLDNFKAAIALRLDYYDLVKTYSTVRGTPAMAADIAQSHWSVIDAAR